MVKKGVMSNKLQPILAEVLAEQQQASATRQRILGKLEKLLRKPVISFFTSFKFPVMLEDADCDLLEDILEKTDLASGLVLLISSPGGDGLAAERFVNICRSYSGTQNYSAVVCGKAKSAATMICFGASEIIMGRNSELGPVDPQVTVEEDGVLKRFSVFNLIQGYEDLFARAVKENGNLEPYLLQLSKYDEREIKDSRLRRSSQRTFPYALLNLV